MGDMSPEFAIRILQGAKVALSPRFKATQSCTAIKIRSSTTSPAKWPSLRSEKMWRLKSESGSWRADRQTREIRSTQEPPIRTGLRGKENEHMKIEAFCRNKKAGWTGVIFQEDDGRTRITNGTAIWDDSEKRRVGLELVEEIDLEDICNCLERYHLHEQLLAALRAFPREAVPVDQIYLARPLLEGLTYEISETRICIKSQGSELAGARGPNARLDKKTLLEQYQRVYQAAKAQGAKINFCNHYRRKIQTVWKEYESAAAVREELYHKLMEQARVLQKRGIHVGYTDDAELQQWRELYGQYAEYYHSLNPCCTMERTAQELAGLEQALISEPNEHDVMYKVYL